MEAQRETDSRVRAMEQIETTSRQSAEDDPKGELVAANGFVGHLEGGLKG